MREYAEKLLAREKPSGDGARPSGNSIAVLNLQRLYSLTENADYAQRAEMTLRVFADQLAAGPSGMGRMLDALDFMLDTPKEILIVTPPGGNAEPFLAEFATTYLPNRVIGVAEQGQVEALTKTIPLFEFKRAIGGETTAYVCENRVCDLPTQDPQTFRAQIRKRAKKYPGASP